MNNNKLNIIVFILSIICFFISLKLFFNMMVFVDEYNTSPDIVCGGEIWLFLNWIKLGLLFIISFILGKKVFYNK